MCSYKKPKKKKINNNYQIIFIKNYLKKQNILLTVFLRLFTPFIIKKQQHLYINYV